MRIPKKFTVGGQEINVEIVEREFDIAIKDNRCAV